jgi:rhodanese-related sulfurtransferase
VEVQDIARRDQNTLLLDVREPEEYAHGHVPGAVSLPQAELATRLDEVPRDRPIIAICQTGVRSVRAAQFLKQQGYGDVRSLDGGTEAWLGSGGPVDYGDRTLDKPRITESEWGHAGVLRP